MSEEKTVVASENSAETTSDTAKKGAPALLQYDGGTPGKRFLLVTNPIIIGRRADKVQVWIDDASVSREHCRVDFQGTKATVTDLGSLNHSYVNDQMVMQSAELCHGDMLRVGNVRLRYFAHGSADQILFDKIYRMAVHDKMLDIFRKEHFLEKLDEEFRLAKSNSQALSIIFFDLDRFKNINDTYGHPAGDFILKEVVSTVKTMLRPTDTFGRYGGEEFCVLLPRTTTNEAEALAELVRSSVEKSIYDYEGTHLSVTLSLGVTSLNDHVASPQEWIKHADSLVYTAKRSGRNRVVKG